MQTLQPEPGVFASLLDPTKLFHPEQLFTKVGNSTSYRVQGHPDSGNGASPNKWLLQGVGMGKWVEYQN